MSQSFLEDGRMENLLDVVKAFKGKRQPTEKRSLGSPLKAQRQVTIQKAKAEVEAKDERELEDLIELYARITSESQQLSNGKRDEETDKALRAKLAQAKRSFQIRWEKLPEAKQMQMVDRLIGDGLLPGIIADALKIFDGAKVISLI